MIAGGGLSGLTLAVHLCQSDFFKQKRIVIIERSEKNTNDRTWCFWAKDSEEVPPCIYRSWNYAYFKSQSNNIDFPLAPYRYKMIRSADFYHWAKSQIEGKVEWISDTIESIEESQEGAKIQGKTGQYKAKWVFNSALLHKNLYPQEPTLFPKPYFSETGVQSEKSTTKLLQHFKGFYIKTKKPMFEVDKIHLMDFRIAQHNATRFVYVLPFSTTEALVEFTLFSAELLAPEAYSAAIRSYLKSYWDLTDFDIIEEEFGIIPMTDARFEQQPSPHVFNIGTAGGFVKASSGYAFLRTQRKIRALVQHWEAYGKPQLPADSTWKYMMDKTLLRVLKKGTLTGADVFSALFASCSPTFILRFLDEDTSKFEDVKIAWAMPSLPFMRAFLGL